MFVCLFVYLDLTAWHITAFAFAKQRYLGTLGTRRLRRKAVEFRQPSGMHTNLSGMRMRVKRANDAHVKVRRVTRLSNELYRTHIRSLCTSVCETLRSLKGVEQRQTKASQPWWRAGKRSDDKQEAADVLPLDSVDYSSLTNSKKT